ncbi:hypothetical protein E2320_002157, partial [Naja naja]
MFQMQLRGELRGAVSQCRGLKYELHLCQTVEIPGDILARIVRAVQGIKTDVPRGWNLTRGFFLDKDTRILSIKEIAVCDRH